MSCIVCFFRLASFILHSAVGVTNLLLKKNLVEFREFILKI